VTEAVFHAPMFALNADAKRNACEPSRTRSTPTEPRSHLPAPGAWAPDRKRTRARARTDAARARACGGPASAIRSPV
jgi:hypothetical protein